MTDPGNAEESQNEAPPRRRLEVNPEALRVVPAARRQFWEQLKDDVQIDVAEKFRKRWTPLETVRVITATPDETYEEVAADLGRSPGAVRYRRQAMIHLLRQEHGAPERVAAYLANPKGNHKQHDYYQVHKTLDDYGYYSRPVNEQWSLAKPLRQPST
ncbi:MAG: hypothetical protein M3256_25945, partial [Actinomycetota bacterium]|nr:hypothetical protein [Actinomycetota bacterium]